MPKSFHQRRKQRIRKIESVTRDEDWVPVVYDSEKRKYVKCDPDDAFHVRCVDCGHVQAYNQNSYMADHRLGLNKAGRKCKKKRSANARVFIAHRPFR